MKKQIENKEDVTFLVESFYVKVLKDSEIGYIFTDVLDLDMEAHLPKISLFWEMVLLGTGGYDGNVMQAHLQLDKKTELKKEHFARWKELFFETLDEHFEGGKVDEAKARVRNMEALMMYKIEQGRNKGFIQ